MQTGPALSVQGAQNLLSPSDSLPVSLPSLAPLFEEIVLPRATGVTIFAFLIMDIT